MKKIFLTSFLLSISFIVISQHRFQPFRGSKFVRERQLEVYTYMYVIEGDTTFVNDYPIACTYYQPNTTSLNRVYANIRYRYNIESDDATKFFYQRIDTLHISFVSHYFFRRTKTASEYQYLDNLLTTDRRWLFEYIGFYKNDLVEVGSPVSSMYSCLYLDYVAGMDTLYWGNYNIPYLLIEESAYMNQENLTLYKMRFLSQEGLDNIYQEIWYVHNLGFIYLKHTSSYKSAETFLTHIEGIPIAEYVAKYYSTMCGYY